MKYCVTVILNRGVKQMKKLIDKIIYIIRYLMEGEHDRYR
jgi:hypothetical protein